MRLHLVILICSLSAIGETAPSDSLSGSNYKLSVKTDLPLSGIGLAGCIGAFLAETSPASLTRAEISLLSRDDVNAMDRNATFHYSHNAGRASDVLSGVLIVAPLGLITAIRGRNSVTTFSVMYAEVLMLAYALPSLGKQLSGRARPYLYNPDVPLENKLGSDALSSFFSRHTTIAFASACYLSTVFDDAYPHSESGRWVRIAALSAASATGYLRYAAGQHFPSDILVGALVGSAIGFGVPFAHTHGSKKIRVSLNHGEPGVFLLWDFCLPIAGGE
ncbi:MAG: phosphatase PAP2 family protein [Chitinispirillaceae bacterium]|nr:phosphatase PAP2 family protein [Chitinispirillaceae bacterium]